MEYSNLSSIARIFFIALLAASTGFSQNQAPQIPNITAIHNSGNGTVQITYDLTDAENDAIEISLKASSNDGLTYLVNTDNATGDVGYPVHPASDLQIEWNYPDSISNITDYTLKLVADDRFEIEIQTVVDQVDSTRLKQTLQFIAQERNRNTNFSHLTAVKDTISGRFNTYGLQTSRQSFQHQGYTAHNINGRLQGQGDEQTTYIVDAHFDAVPNCPGADDNGSGVAGFLEAARVLSQYNFNHSIRFIGFDLEELGLIGSQRYVNQGGIHSYDSIAGVFNYEMIGYYSDEHNSQNFPFGFEILFPEVYAQVESDTFQGDFITNVANNDSEDLMMRFDSAAARYVPDLEVHSLAVSGNGTNTPDLRRSDHASFWDGGYKALMLTDGANFRNPNYHKPSDSVKTIDYSFMANVVKATVGAICEEAGIQHSTVATAEIEGGTAIDPVSLAKGHMEIYPNPADENLQVELTGLDRKIGLRVIDNTGKTLLERNERVSNNARLDVDISTFQPGLYYIEVTDGGQTLEQKLIVE